MASKTSKPGVLPGRVGDAINIPQDHLLQGIAEYSEDEQALYLWLFGYARDVLHGSRTALCEALGYDWTVVTRIANGRYGDDLQRARFRARVEELRAQAARMVGTEFVETIVTRKIFAALDLARDYHSAVSIAGASGRSKTWAVREWQLRNNHGRAVYVDCPVIGGVGALLSELARCGTIGSGHNNTVQLAQRLLRTWDHRHTIILDEAVRLLPSSSRTRAIQPLEFLRRLHDVAGVGLAFVSTKILPDEMEHGRLAVYLEQLFGRIEEPLRIPDQVSTTEARDICLGFTDAPSRELIALAQKIGNGRGRVRVLFSVLRQAARLAQKKDEPLDAPHLKAAYAYRQNIHRWPED